MAQQNEFQSKIHDNHIRHFNLIFSREASKPKHPQSKHHENQKFADAVQKVNIRNNPAE
jgi:hypothetical protein